MAQVFSPRHRFTVFKLSELVRIHGWVNRNVFQVNIWKIKAMLLFLSCWLLPSPGNVSESEHGHLPVWFITWPTVVFQAMCCHSSTSISTLVMLLYAAVVLCIWSLMTVISGLNNSSACLAPLFQLGPSLRCLYPSSHRPIELAYPLGSRMFKSPPGLDKSWEKCKMLK